MEHKYKIITIKISNDSYFILKHLQSKYYNDFTNEIINLEQLLNELQGYANNNIIYLEDIVEIKDTNNNIINYEELYSMLDGLIIADKLINKRLSLININKHYALAFY